MEMKQGTAAIEASHIYKSFRGTEVLKDISLRCEPGRIYGFVGHNGSGKTVLFKCICGFLACDSGEIRVGGKVMGKELDMLTDAGIIIEEPGFLRKWSAYHNLEFLYTIRNRKDKAYLCSILEKVGLEPGLRRPVGKYSLGMKQRLAIAQAIMEDPRILILDEPTDHLDMESITALNNGLIKFPGVLLFASRDHQVVQTTANRIIEFLPNGAMIDKVTTYDEYLESDEMARKRQVYSTSNAQEEDD